jgi:hypothetical protein
MIDFQDRAAGCLFGLALGDPLGAKIGWRRNRLDFWNNKTALIARNFHLLTICYEHTDLPGL